MTPKQKQIAARNRVMRDVVSHLMHHGSSDREAILAAVPKATRNSLAQMERNGYMRRDETHDGSASYIHTDEGAYRLGLAQRPKIDDSHRSPKGTYLGEELQARPVRPGAEQAFSVPSLPFAAGHRPPAPGGAKWTAF